MLRTRRIPLIRPIPRIPPAPTKLMEQIRELNPEPDTSTPLRISHDLVSIEAVLKTCYWFSRDFVCDVQEDGSGHSLVSLKPKPSSTAPLIEARESFMAHALDFALRERVTAKTIDVRDLLLAKAFSESGVLEEKPQGVFGDPLEEAKPDGMFKILSKY
jgi:His-Xaa-Ser system protein HxsD